MGSGCNHAPFGFLDRSTPAKQISCQALAKRWHGNDLSSAHDLGGFADH
jgi:hypothetical protein